MSACDLTQTLSWAGINEIGLFDGIASPLSRLGDDNLPLPKAFKGTIFAPKPVAFGDRRFIVDAY